MITFRKALLAITSAPLLALLAAPLLAVLAAPLLAVLAAPLLAVGAAQAQTSQTASLLDALSLISGGMLVAPAAAPEVVQDGQTFHVRIPLPGLTQPPRAAVEAVATPADGGAWNFSSLILPAHGSAVTPGAPGKPPVTMDFTIGQQEAHGRIDPSLASPSPYEIALGSLSMQVEGGGAPVDIKIGHMSMAGLITGDADHRMNLQSRNASEAWAITGVAPPSPNPRPGAAPTGGPFLLAIRSATVRYDVNGLNRAQAAHLREVRGKLLQAVPPAPPIPNQRPGMSPAARAQLLALLDATAGMMTGMDIEETLNGLHFETAQGNNGDIGEVRLALAGKTEADTVAGHADTAITDMALTAMPAAYASYVPHRFEVRAAFSGISADGLRSWLRAAAAENPNPEAIRDQGIALVHQPGAHVGIESLLIDAAPLLVKGNAQVDPLPDGTVGYDVHLTAQGVDAMIAKVQTDPAAQQLMPILFLAKGMGRPEGETLAWDIVFAHGIVTVNGMRMGPRPGAPPSAQQPRPTRPPVMPLPQVQRP